MRFLSRAGRQFSLKWLVCAMTVLAIGLMPVAMMMDAMRRQRWAIAQLESRGVLVGYASQWTEASGREAAPRTSPRWGDSFDFSGFFQKPVDFVAAVEFKLAAEKLSPVLQLTEVTTLSYVNSPVTADVIEIFGQLPQLRILNLSDTDLGDDALVEIAKIETLEYISIMGTKVTPAAVMEFKRTRPDCTISSDLDTRFLTCLKRILQLKASKPD